MSNTDAAQIAGDAMMWVVRRMCLLIPLCVLWLSSTAAASISDAQLWTALGGNIVCGVATHQPNTPPMQLLCSATKVPPPKGRGIGDGGFVFLGSTGRPSLARLSQDSFVGTDQVTIAAGKWAIRQIGVRCSISTSTVRCVNRSRHGFTISESSYRSF